MSFDRTICSLALDRWEELGHHGTAAPSGLVVLKLQSKRSDNGSIVALLCDRDTQGPVAVVKIPRNPRDTSAIDRESQAMSLLARHYGDWELRDSLVAHGFTATVSGIRVLFQQAAKGHSLVRELRTAASAAAASQRAADWLLAFNRHVAQRVVLRDDELRRLVVEPLRVFDALVAAGEHLVTDATRAHLAQLPDRVAGRSISLVPQHGDFNAHNIVGRKLRGQSLLAVIDWEDFRLAQLPIHDVNHLFTSNSKLIGRDMTAARAYRDLVVRPSWYQSLFARVVSQYERAGLVDTDTFLALTPMYMVESALRMTDPSRQQDATIHIWVDRLNQFVSAFLGARQ